MKVVVKFKNGNEECFETIKLIGKTTPYIVLYEPTSCGRFVKRKTKIRLEKIQHLTCDDTTLIEVFKIGEDNVV